MKLTRKILDGLIYEVIEEHQQKRMNIATQNDVRKHREELRKDREARYKREQEYKTIPKEMTQLSKGILEEDHEQDEDGFIRIEKHKLDRLLDKTKEDVERWARGMGWKPIDEWLRVSSQFIASSKGKYEA